MDNEILENQDICFSFPVSVFGNLTPYNDVISKGRVRIFYKGLNRNNTYISDEFAEKLLSTISYSPICGIYDEDDFTDHGKERDTAKAYGVVPENPNIAWETHLDPDGVEREYACADVLLWTARYKEAREVPGKSQSMELYRESIKGKWEYIDGKKVFKFTDACFIGLTPLGDSVEPCFEGAAFYTLTSTLKEMVEELKNYNLQKEKIEKGGKSKMVINFKLTDSQKHEKIWNLLNPNFNEEGNWEVAYSIHGVYDEYALVYEYETGNYYRVYYTKDDENDTVTLGEKEQTFVMDVTAAELEALKIVKAMNNDSFEKINEVFETNANEVERLISLVTEKDASIEELNEQVNAYTQTIEELNNTNATLTSAKEELENYKAEKLLSEKKNVLSQYNDKLDEEVVNEFSLKLDQYSVEELKKELAAQLVDSHPELFSKNNQVIIGNYSDEGSNNLSPAAKLLQKYRNKKNNGGEN